MRRYLRLRELVWVGGCVTAPVAWPSPPGGDAGVYTDRWKRPLDAVLGHLCTLLRLARIVRAAVATQECTQIGQNGLSTPFRGTCVHCCAVADNRGYAGVYTDWPRWPLDAVSGHLCTLLRRDSPRRQPTRTPEEHIFLTNYSAGETMLDRSWRYFPATLYAPCLARLRCPASF